MEFRDYYATLGVARDASEKDIKQAFRRLARQHHPDVNPGDQAAERRFKDLNEAYEVLGNPESRRKYDELGANWRQYEQTGARGGPGGFAYGAGGGFRPMDPSDFSEVFGGESPFSDFFRTFFSGADEVGSARGARTGAQARTGRGRDIEHEIELSLDDVLHGITRRLTVNQGGVARSVDVRIPPGVSEGSRVRVAGEGARGSGSARSGDLFLRVRLRPHPVFERRGRDLSVRVRVSAPTAVLGGEVEVPCLDGRSIRLKVPVGTQPGQVFRVRGQGLPSATASDARGDLYATVEITVPAQVTPEARRHWEALRAYEAGGDGGAMPQTKGGRS